MLGKKKVTCSPLGPPLAHPGYGSMYEPARHPPASSHSQSSEGTRPNQPIEGMLAVPDLTPTPEQLASHGRAPDANLKNRPSFLPSSKPAIGMDRTPPCAWITDPKNAAHRRCCAATPQSTLRVDWP